MTVRFPDEPGFQGRFAPVRLEGEIRGVEVTQGEIPASLRGTFYRVGADPAWPPFVERDFYFNADGMVAMFRFENGYCDFRSRYVRTPRFAAERAARRSLFGAYRNPFTDDPSVAGLSPRARQHERVLARRPAAGLQGGQRAGPDRPGHARHDRASSPGTATCRRRRRPRIPKIDPRTGELVFFGYMAKGEATRDIAYYEADATGRIVHEAWFEAPYSSMVHDWAVTENFVVFPIIPLTASLDRLKAGGPLYVWDGSEDVYLGVVPRKARPTVRWYRGTNRFASHIMNAYDDGRYIHIDTPVGEKSGVPVVPRHRGRAVRPGEGERAASRWTIDTQAPPDLGDGTTAFEQRRLTDCSGEFPRTDDRWATRGLPVRGHQPDRRSRARGPTTGCPGSAGWPDRPGLRRDEDPVRRARTHGAGGDLRAAVRRRHRATARGT